MADNKKIQISSSLDIQAESLHEVIRDPNTGETKVIDKQEPHQQIISTTVTTNPVKYEAKGTEEPKVTEGKAEEIEEKAVEVDPAAIGYDTSQL